MNSTVGRVASAIVVSSQDYANGSRFLVRYSKKVRIVPLLIRIAKPNPVEVQRFRSLAASGGPLIGIADRLAADKGFEVLIDALPLVENTFPGTRVICAGNYRIVVGEDNYRRRMLPKIEELGDWWHMLGIVEPNLASFFTACDVLAVPSLNRTESLGLVQAEAMLCGTPVVTSDLPGMRVPIQSTGMGKLFRAGDPASLAEAIVDVLKNPLRPRNRVQP